MSIQAVAWALDQDIPKASVKLVLICICNHADKADGTGYPTVGTLAREASMSMRSVHRQLIALLDLGLITYVNVFDRLTGRQMANTYRVVFDPGEQMACITSREEDRKRGFVRQGEGDSLAPSQPVENLVYQGGTEPFDQCQSVRGEGDNVVIPGGDTAVIPNNHHKKPSEESLAGGRERARDGFEQLWRNHPPAFRPRDRRSAELMFEKLDAEDKRQCIEQHAAWMKWQAAQQRALSLPAYFRNRAWRMLDGGPPITSDGRFKITPERPEWKPWLASVEARFGPRGVELIKGFGFYLPKQRWPDGYVAEPQQIGFV